MSAVEAIAETTGEKLSSLSDKVMNFLNTADLTDPGQQVKMNLFVGQLSTFSQLGSTLLKVFFDTAKSTIHNMT